MAHNPLTLSTKGVEAKGLKLGYDPMQEGTQPPNLEDKVHRG